MTTQQSTKKSVSGLEPETRAADVEDRQTMQSDYTSFQWGVNHG